MMNKLLIFDLDGTLVNTVVDLNAGINYALNKNGYTSRSVNHTSKVIGNGIFTTILRSLPSIDEKAAKLCLTDFRNYYKDHYLDNSVRYNGMLETMTELKKRGYFLAVATNKLDEIAKKMIDYLYPNIFDIVVGDKLNSPKKPDPYIISQIICDLNVDKENVTYIGDSEVDIESASNAKINLVLVDYGFHRSKNYLNDSHGLHISKPIDLLKIF